VILTSYVMIVLDISVVITGLPRLAADLGSATPGSPSCRASTR
jgi:hypothetical protein